MPSLAGRRLSVPAVQLLLLLLASSSASAANFTCAALGTTCNSAIAYEMPNTTTYGDLVARFNTTTTLTELLGANGLPASTLASTPLAAKTAVRVPFRCRCGSNGVGQSEGGPIYVVYPQDGLDHIARDVFDAFVTYQEIATANNITDVNLIQIGQKLRIPLPCTCDQVDGADVMHLAYSVAKGDDTPGIAAMFGVTESTLLNVNKITDPKTLQQGQILDVPLPACNSSINPMSADHNLLLPHGTYALTARGCVLCRCGRNDQQLDCVPLEDEWCPASVPACTGALKLGQACGSKMCAYDGYVSDNASVTIFTTLVAADNKTSSCPNVSAGPLIDLSAGPRRQNKLILKVALPASICLILTCLACTMYCWKKIYHVSFQMYNGSICSKNKYNGNESNIEDILKGYDSFIPKRYKYSEVKKITGTFKHILGEGGYGTVYKGKLEDGRKVAVKLLKGLKGNGEEFLNEVVSIRRTSHINIVNLVGFCLHGSKRALIYDYMVNGSLDKYIYSEETKMAIGWDKLREIALGIARGLEYLHRGCNARIIHFDIKPHNVLLDEDFCPKIADFGLAKLCHLKDNSALSMAEARGTIGFIAPEVFSRGFGVVSTKSDVYSYGMVLLEMVVGRKNIKKTTGNSSEAYFPDWVYDGLAKDFQSQEDVACESEETARHLTLVALWCIQTSPRNRPSIRKVIEMLEKNISELEMPPKPLLSCPSPPSHFSS